MESGTDTLSLPLLPLADAVVLPGMVLTLSLESSEALAAWQSASEADGRVVIVPRRDGIWPRVGTVAVLEEVAAGRRGRRVVAVRAESRATLGTGVAGPGPATWIEVEPVEPEAPGPAVADLAKEYRGAVEALLEGRGAGGLARSLRALSDPGALADAAGYLPDLTLEQRVQLLETVEVEPRLRLALGWVKEALASSALADKIRTDVAEGMDRTQREFLLRQQLAAIRKELGEDSPETVVSDYRQRLEAIGGMPDPVRRSVTGEIDRLERTQEASPEHGWIRAWLDTVFELPWGVHSESDRDVVAARAVLDADHFGLDKVKDRIVEHLAVRQLRTARGAAEPDNGIILALVGPPGVGKTSLGASVARAMGRKMARVSLGGVHDEAELRGHRRTYVGALPGRIVRAIAEAGTMDPVIVLDEVDKLGADWRGDPSSALLEVLDPAQNNSFRDHYLDFELDLSKVVFLATANVMDTIPPALSDRLEIIRLDGYTEEEKVAIARVHLLPRVLEGAGLEPDELELDEAALRAVIADWTDEAGVRELERRLARIARKVAAAVAAGDGERPHRVGVDDLVGFLGRRRPRPERRERPAVAGVAVGLAVTGSGGDVLEVEAARLEDAGPGDELTLTGQLGDVMSESARIALSYVRSHASQLGIEPPSQGRWHVHVPAGAVPKDGPSAGVTMVTALASLTSGRPVRRGLAMTGEVSLQGRVLPVGGIKQKVLAAHRAGMTELILPVDNGPDLEDVPEEVRQALVVHLVSDATEVVHWALEPSSGLVAGDAAALDPAA